MEDKYVKLRELRGLQGSVLALKNQMEDTMSQIIKAVDKKYVYSECTDEEKKVMDDIEIMIEEIDKIWNSKIC